MLVEVAILLEDDASHPIVGVRYRDAALLQVNGDSVLLGVRRERIPHLAWAETRIPEFFDERRHVLTPQAENRQDRLSQ
jgi:hypothetical protein